MQLQITVAQLISLVIVRKHNGKVDELTAIVEPVKIVYTALCSVISNGIFLSLRNLYISSLFMGVIEKMGKEVALKMRRIM